ncbi:MAG: DUF692 family protein [Anaerolineae bacterium]|nr:DUF692 family protein [Anaerolineae bacterium]
MNFSINYSPQAAKLVKTGQIEIDYFKTPPWKEMIAIAEKIRPIAIHFEIRTADIKSMNKNDWVTVDQFLKSTATAFVNIHLSVNHNDLPHIPTDELPTQVHQEEVIECMLIDLQIMTSRFGSDRIVAENAPYRKNQNYILRACVEADVISQIVYEADCGLLLDISHARITSQNLNIDPKKYMESLPINRLRELHFTGLHNWEGYLQDHLPLLEDDWPWLDWVLGKVNEKQWNHPHLLAFEYGGTGDFYGRFSDPAVISEQVPRMYRKCHAL